ncbi:hypothetical protein F8B81_22790 [Escherichia coli]|nr:hypothetical protein [Escherichia coli]
MRAPFFPALSFFFLSFFLPLFSLISAAIAGLRCASFRVPIPVAWLFFTTIMLSALPSSQLSLSANSLPPLSIV